MALADDDIPGVRAALQPLLDLTAAGGSFTGADYPRHVEFTCYQVLARLGDPRAAEWLTCAHSVLTTAAGQVPDPVLRHGLLHNIPFHREIVAAWPTPPPRLGTGADAAVVRRVASGLVMNRPVTAC